MHKIFALLGLVLFFNISSYSQTDTLKKFTFPSIQLSIGEIFHLIENNSSFRFSYNPGKIHSDSIIRLPGNPLNFTEIKDALFQMGVDMYQRGDHIIVKPVEIIPQKITKGKQYTIYGYVRDRENLESMIGATIVNLPGGVGTITNSYGFFSLTLSQGNYTIQCSYIGYETVSETINLNSDLELIFKLPGKRTEIEEVIIKENPAGQTLKNLDLGRSEISLENIRKIPGFMGEADVIKSLQSIPGIHFYSDGSTIFHVRGGARDQNLLLIDEAPVYNPAHMLGIFSVFSPDALNSVDIYKGDMPAWYGGRLSSVVDIKMREGNSQNTSFSGNMSPVATTLNLEAPLFNKKGSFYISGRRSHLKWILGQEAENLEQLHFSDFNLKSNYRFNNKNRIFFSFYNGIDRFRTREAINKSTGIFWKNFAGNIRWNHIFGERLFSNTSIIASNYDYNLYTSYQENQRWNAGISLFAIKYDFSFYIHPNSTLYYGIYLGNHSYFPGNFYSGTVKDPLIPGVPDKFASETALYISHKISLGERWRVMYGFRFGNWGNRGEATEFIYNENNRVQDTVYYSNKVYNRYDFFEPRLNLRFLINKYLSARLAYAKNTQNEFLITNSISPFTSLEIWLPAGPNIQPMHSRQLSAGLNYMDTNRPFSFDLDFFYKDIRNYISYIDHAYMLFNPYVETQLRTGYAKAYGAEMIVKKTTGKWNGWVSYAYSRIFLQIPEVNNFSYYPARYDRPHSLSLYLEYIRNPRWKMSAAWMYSSGSPITTPTGYYDYMGYQVPFYEERNNDRLPDYHRLDISTSIRLNSLASQHEHILNLSIFNLYSRKNPFNINFNKIIDEDGNVVVPSDYVKIPELETTMMYLFGMVPSISYHFKF